MYPPNKPIIIQKPTVDMDRLKAQNQHIVAVGNKSVNARGDIVQGGKVIKTKEELAKEKYAIKAPTANITNPVLVNNTQVQVAIKEQDQMDVVENQAETIEIGGNHSSNDGKLESNYQGVICDTNNSTEQSQVQHHTDEVSESAEVNYQYSEKKVEKEDSSSIMKDTTEQVPFVPVDMIHFTPGQKPEINEKNVLTSMQTAGILTQPKQAVITAQAFQQPKESSAEQNKVNQPVLPPNMKPLVLGKTNNKLDTDTSTLGKGIVGNSMPASKTIQQEELKSPKKSQGIRRF